MSAWSKRTVADAFNEQGYAVVRRLFADADIKRLVEIVDRIYAQWLDENRAEVVEHRLVNMHSLTDPRYFHGHEGERLRFFQTLACDALTTLVDGMFGDGVYFHNTQLFFNPPENNRRPYWHRDMQYSPVDDAALEKAQGELISLHVRIPLVPERGLELIPGTHRRWDTPLERDVRLERNGHQNDEDLPDAMLIELAPGDVVIFDAQMIHRGNYGLNPTRKALDLCLGKAHPFTSPYLDEHNLPDANALANITNGKWFKAANKIAISNRRQNGGHR